MFTNYDSIGNTVSATIPIALKYASSQGRLKNGDTVMVVGFGLGLLKVGDDQDADKLTGSYNFIVGSSLNVWSGDLYVDFTARNAFRYNQLIVGYRFPF